MGLAFLITTDHLQLLSERKVLKEDEYASLLDATSTVEVARAEALRLVEGAKREVDEARQRGYLEGRQNAKAEFAKQLVSEAAGMERQLGGLRATIATIVTKAVTRFMEEADPQTLYASALRRVDLLIRSEPFLTVRVCAEQQHAIRGVLARLRQELGWQMSVTVFVDPDLADGDCVIQTASGSVEIGLDAQLEELQRLLRNAHAFGSAGDGR